MEQSSFKGSSNTDTPGAPTALWAQQFYTWSREVVNTNPLKYLWVLWTLWSTTDCHHSRPSDNCASSQSWCVAQDPNPCLPNACSCFVCLALMNQRDNWYKTASYVVEQSNTSVSSGRRRAQTEKLESWGLLVYVFRDIRVYQHRNLTCSALLKDKCVLRGCLGENGPMAEVGEQCLLCSSVGGIKTMAWHNANSRARVCTARDFSEGILMRWKRIWKTDWFLGSIIFLVP